MTDYRPTTFDGIVGQPTAQIEGVLDGRNTPNFLFHGPPGTGKTTAAYVISRRLQGDPEQLMEFNASDDRGIEAVRTQIIPAVNQSTLSGAPRVVFLDEMDSMTTEAQQALRQPMEQSDAIFILACNDLGAVHDAVQSRCHVVEFGQLEDRAIRRRISQIAAEEGVDLDANEEATIVSFANGDMRTALQRYTAVARGAVASKPDGAAETDGKALEARAQEFLGEN